jgi:hypothetical protein
VGTDDDTKAMEARASGLDLDARFSVLLGSR